MTYSLTEKEEILYERAIEELFNLTEVTPNIPDDELKRYKSIDITPAHAAALKRGKETDHYTDVYDKTWYTPPRIEPVADIDPQPDDTSVSTTDGKEGEGGELTPWIVGPPLYGAAAKLAKNKWTPQSPKNKLRPRPSGTVIDDPKKKPPVKVDDPLDTKKKTDVKDPDTGHPRPRPETRVTGKVVNADAQKAKEKWMADEEIKAKAAERKAAKKLEAEKKRKAEELRKKVDAEEDLKKKKALEKELKKQLAAVDDLELKAEKEKIAREVELRKTAEAKAEKRRLERAEARAKREGKLKLAEELRIKKMKATVALSGAEKLALRAGATQAEILSTQLDVTGNLHYQDVVPEPLKSNPVEISKEKLSNAQRYASKANRAATIAKANLTALQQSGEATAAELAAADEEFKRASLDSLNARKQHELLQANNETVKQQAKAKKNLISLENYIMKQEAELVKAKRQGTPAKISTITQKLENAKIEQKIAIEAEKKLGNAKNVQSLAIKIQKNDTLGKIAKRYGVTVKELVAVNKITNPDLIIAGEKLNIPVKGSNAFAPGTKFSKSQIDNILTQKQRNLIKPGEIVWIDTEGNIRSSTKLNDPNAINLSDPPEVKPLPEPTDRITTPPVEPEPSKIKKGTIGVIPNAEATRLGWQKGTEIKIKNGKAMLQLPGGRPMYISNADANRILSAMGKPPTLVGNIARKSLTTAGAMLKGMGRLATGAVLGFGLKGEIVSTVVMTSAMMYGSSRMLRNIDAEQKRMEKKLPGNALSQLSPPQYLGGVGNQGRYHDATQDQMGGAGKRDTGGIWSSDKMIAELLSHDDVITRTLENTTDKNLKDLKES